MVLGPTGSLGKASYSCPRMGTSPSDAADRCTQTCVEIQLLMSNYLSDTPLSRYHLNDYCSVKLERRAAYGKEKRPLLFLYQTPLVARPLFDRLHWPEPGNWHPVSVEFLVLFVASSRHWVSWNALQKTVCEIIEFSLAALLPYFALLAIFHPVEEVFFDGVMG